LVRGLRVLKGIGGEDVATQRYQDASARALRATLRAAVPANVIQATNVLIGGLLLAAVAYVGGRLALEQDISVGELVAAVGLTQFLSGPLQRIAYAGSLRAQGRASAERIAAILDAPPCVEDGARRLTARGPGHLHLAGLDLEGRGDAFDLELGAGEHLGVVIPDLSAVSALLDLLARRAEPEATTVTVDGVAFGDLRLSDAHRTIVVSDRDADLFEGTVKDNIEAMVPGLASERVEEILVATGADEVVDSVEGGYEGDVGERGRKLSGGQRQRVALARALAADPPILVLNDPTTAVDAMTEARIARGLRSIREGRTTVIVASSPALLASCDRVVLVHRGRVEAEGTHDQLVAVEPAYREAVLR
jgi:putative ABC transport system ATP-binding protein